MQSGLQLSQQGKEAPTARLKELLLEAYKNSRIYKKKEGVSSQPESKLRSRWDRPFVITNVFPYGAVELKDENTNNTSKLTDIT
ncbi:hypothetical protein CR513_54539, partial [Mucuna pruriens]